MIIMFLFTLLLCYPSHDGFFFQFVLSVNSVTVTDSFIFLDCLRGLDYLMYLDGRVVGRTLHFKVINRYTKGSYQLLYSKCISNPTLMQSFDTLLLLQLNQ